MATAHARVRVIVRQRANPLPEVAEGSAKTRTGSESQRGFALLSAMSFAINGPFYKPGGNIQAVNLARPWLFLLCPLVLICPLSHSGNLIWQYLTSRCLRNR